MKPILLTILCFYVTILAAQPTEEPSFKRFAVLAGVNISNMNFNKGFFPPATPVAASWKTGFTIGALMRVKLVNKLFLQPEYYYTQRKGADKSVQTDYTVNYFSLPFLINYKVTSFISLVAGPQAELLIKGTQSKAGIDSSITHNMEERSLGVTAGADIEIKKNFIISARYMLGLNHVGISRQSYEREFKYEVIRLSAGLAF